jgi:hypothetical protein
MVRPQGSPEATRAKFCDKSVRVGIGIFAEFLWASRVARHLVWISKQTRCLGSVDSVIYFS